MKKFMLSLAVVTALVFTSCSSDDDGGGADCATLIQAVEDAGEAYVADIASVEKCNAFRAALQAAINGNCGSAEELEEAEDALALLTCE